MKQINTDSKEFLNKLCQNSLSGLKLQDFRWKSYSFTLVNPEESGLLQNIRKKLSASDRTLISGVYVFYKGRTCIYVGQSQDIAYRIYHHCRTAWGYTGSKKWKRFFSQFKDQKIKVKWYKITAHEDKLVAKLIRTISELYFTKELKSKFIEFE